MLGETDLSRGQTKPLRKVQVVIHDGYAPQLVSLRPLLIATLDQFSISNSLARLGDGQFAPDHLPLCSSPHLRVAGAPFSMHRAEASSKALLVTVEPENTSHDVSAEAALNTKSPAKLCIVSPDINNAPVMLHLVCLLEKEPIL